MTADAHVDGLASLVRDAARRMPHATAVHDGDRRVTYAQLDALAGRYAAGLASCGVGRGDRVVLWLDKTADAVAVMQGVLRLGACYVPISAANPPERVRRIGSACDAAAVVVDDRVEPVPLERPVHRLSDLRAGGHGGCPIRPANPDDLAYMLFTSGSTGEPKGVCVSHGNALAFVCWAAGETGLRADDRLANHAPLNFDLSVFDLYGAFHAGAAVDLVPTVLSYAPADLVAFLHERGITVWYSVPSALLIMMREGGLLAGMPPRALRTCVFAGEPFPLEDVLRLRAAWPTVRMFNWYGPTETNVCTSYEVTHKDLVRRSPLPIGAASSGDRVWLDPPDAAVGEIVVAGPSVMLGYWGRPAHSGPYRTGDLGRWGSDGVLHYLGRRDDMLKVRGHRIEPAEVETALAGHPDLVEVAVVAVGAGLDARLHAVVVPRPGGGPTLLSLKQRCATILPPALVIDTMSLTDRLPRTANGKLDRAAVTRSCVAPPGVPDRPTVNGAPMTHEPAHLLPDDVRRAVRRAAAAALHVEDVSDTADLTALGVDSLVATIIVARLHRELAVEVPLRMVFENPVVADLARAVTGSGDA